MTKQDKLLILQGVGITLQMLNAGIGTVTHNAAIALCVGALISGYQFVIQHLGNQTDPPKG